MMVLQFRTPLLAGLSASTMDLAVPANAATNVSPGISHTDAIEPIEDTIRALADLAISVCNRAAGARSPQLSTTHVPAPCERGQ
jgi:hypothetical protein